MKAEKLFQERVEKNLYDIRWQATLNRCFQAYLADKHKNYVVKSSIRTGKTYLMLQMIYHYIFFKYPAGLDGKKRMRILIARKNWSDITQNLMPDFEKIFLPEIYGRIKNKGQTNQAELFIKISNVECLIHFMAFADDSKISRLGSSAYSLIYIQEASYLTENVFSAIAGRCSFVPKGEENRKALDKKGEPTPFYEKYYLRLIDMNMYPKGSWTYRMFNEKLRDSEENGIYTQPPTVIRDKKGRRIINPDRENKIIFSDKEIYSAMEIQSEEWGRIFLENSYPVFLDKMPVYSRDGETLFTKENFGEMPEGAKIKSRTEPIFIGIDGGSGTRHCAAVIAQFIEGVLYCVGEVRIMDGNNQEFVDALKNYLKKNFPWFNKNNCFGVCDPAGDKKLEQLRDAYTFITWIEKELKINIEKAITNKVLPRREIAKYLIEGKKGAKVVVHELRAPVLSHAIQGGFVYEGNKAQTKTSVKVVKDKYSHVAEAFEYLCIYLQATKKIMDVDLRKYSINPSAVKTKFFHLTSKKFESRIQKSIFDLEKDAFPWEKSFQKRQINIM